MWSIRCAVRHQLLKLCLLKLQHGNLLIPSINFLYIKSTQCMLCWIWYCTTKTKTTKIPLLLLLIITLTSVALLHRRSQSEPPVSSGARLFQIQESLIKLPRLPLTRCIQDRRAQEQLPCKVQDHYLHISDNNVKKENQIKYK